MQNPPCELRVEMESVVVLRLCIITLTMLLTSSCASQDVRHPQTSRENAQVQQLSSLTLPRKLTLLEEIAIKGHDGGSTTLQPKHKVDNSSGANIDNKEEEEEEEAGAKMHGKRKGRWTEWATAGTDTSHYFTMDYSPVRRRRPIHNKSLPVAP